MRVGILSMQRVRNWGSFLQGFALKKTIESMGHECSFIDIKPGVGLKEDEKIKIKRAKGSMLQKKLHFLMLAIKYFLLGQLLIRKKSLAFQKTFTRRYDKVFLPLLGISPEKFVSDESYDIAVIGSDEVFNCTQQNLYNMTMHLFGQGINAKKIISYAASFGYTDVKSLGKYNLRERVVESLEKISNLSVRDENSFKTVKELIGIEPELHVDPVIVYDFDEYMSKSVPERDYIIVYSYQGRIADKQMIAAIKDFARIKGKILIGLYSYYSWCDKNIVADTPFELLTYFKNADYIVTDTFHGTIFSLKYNKTFCTILRKSNNNKLSSLLKQFALDDRVVDGPEDIQRLLDKPIDYSLTNDIIKKEKMKSVDYLSRCLNLEFDSEN